MIERSAYQRFSPRPSAGELARLYTPTLRELDLARRATRGGEVGQVASQSAPVFGLSYILGIELMPRIRNWKALALFRPNGGASYEHIETLFDDEAIDWELIEAHWRDVMRVVASIRAGKMLPSTLLR